MRGGGPDGGAGEPAPCGAGRPEGLPARPAITGLRERTQHVARGDMHSQEVLQTDRQTRLPLVRQRWGLYESEVQKQPLISRTKSDGGLMPQGLSN